MQHKKNYISNKGYAKLVEELQQLITKERPQYVQLVSWAASNGDRSENADYQYGKKKLREIDARIHILNKKIAEAEIVDHKAHQGTEIIFFGATVTILRNNQIQQSVTIVGQDEINPQLNHISWNSPLARVLLKKRVGDSFSFNSPQGEEEIKIIKVAYD
jgi:transcription elongation factor GreB